MSANPPKEPLKSTTTLGRTFRRLPRGSIWQSRYICLPMAIIASTVALTHIEISFLSRVGFFVLGGLTWTFLEYVLHRWVLHWHPKNKNLKEFIENIHLIHHRRPEDDSIVCISAVNCLVLWVVIFAIFLALFGWQVSLLATSGTALMMVIYDITHYSTHYMEPTNWLLKRLKKYHMKHHFTNNRTRFGVTSPVWDYVFGTTK